MRINLKSWTPHIVAIALFILVPVIYFLPALKGLAFHQPDIDNFLGASKEIWDYRARFHTEPLWTNSIFCGMPAYQVSTYYPANLIQYLFHILVYTLPFPAGIVFMYCLGFYILLKVLKIDTRVAVLGSFAYAFSSFFFIILAAGHNSEANAIAFMAPVIAGVILAFSGQLIAGGLLTSLALALELYAGHLQITYYLAIFLVFYVLTRFIQSILQKQVASFFKTCAILAFAAILAVSTNITNLWLTYQYGKYSTRGKSELTLIHEKKSNGLDKSYATQWSYGVDETMTLLLPDFKGGASEQIGNSKAIQGIDPQFQQAVAQSDKYFGDQPFTSGPVYAGAIVCFLAVIGFLIIKGPFRWFLLFITCLSVALAWGKNPVPILGTSVFDLFFNHIPGFNNFRSVSMILVLAELTLPLVAALGIDHLIKQQFFFNEKIKLPFLKNPVTGKKLFFAAFILTGGFAALCWVMPGAFSDFHKHNEDEQLVQEIKQGNPGVSMQQVQQYVGELMPYVEKARKQIFTSDALRTLIFILLAAGLIWVYNKKLITVNWFTGVLIFLIVCDLWTTDKTYLNDDNRFWETKRAVKQPYQPDQADLEIMQDTTPDYRVFNTTIRPDQDSRTSYFHKSLGGYSGVKMKRYDDLLTQIDQILDEINKGTPLQEINMSVVDMLNAKYLIRETRDGQMQAERNFGALGNVWFVDNYKLAANADSEFVDLYKLNPAQTAIVDQRFSSYLSNAHISHDSNASIKLISYEPNDLVYTSQAHSEQLAVFSEIYYKDGWNAYIDGNNAPSGYIRADYVLRAMLIPAGSHKIEFKFEPKEYAIGERISLAGSLFLLVGCFAFLIQQVLGKNQVVNKIHG